MNERKTIQEIKAEYSSKATELLNRRFARVDELAAQRRPTEADPYLLDKMNAAQQAEVLRDEKRQAAERDRDVLRREYRAAHERYARDVAERTAFLRERLFSVRGGESAELLARLATASEAELGSMLDVAAETGNKDLARAVLATSHRRGIPELLVRYFGEIDGEAQALYHEFNEAPSEETVAKQRADIDRMIPAASAEQLAGTPPVYS